MWVQREDGSVVWVEGASRETYPSQPKVSGGVISLGLPVSPWTNLGQQALESRATGGRGFFAGDPARASELREMGRATSRIDVPQEARDLLTSRPWERDFTPPPAAFGPTPENVTPEMRAAWLSRMLEAAGGGGPAGGPDGGPGGGPGGGPAGGPAGGGGDWAGMFRLYETPEEQAMLARELADIEARQRAGDVALRAAWGNVQSANSAAAEKARSMVAAAGDAAASIWIDAAGQAQQIASERAAAVGGFEGRAGIDIDPSLGASDWIGFMESQAPAERAFAERRQESLGRDLDWLAGMAGMQGEAYASDLQRQAAAMAFERSAEHNRRVQDRIAQERMLLGQMQFQASESAAQRAFAAEQAAAGQPSLEARIAELSPVYGQLDGDFGAVMMSRDLNIPFELALEAIQSWRAGLAGRSVITGVETGEAQLDEVRGRTAPVGPGTSGG